MANDPLDSRLRELTWRRQLSPADEDRLRSWMAAHPDAQTDWEIEKGLNEALDHLPDAPVPSNFTARVLQAAARHDASEARRADRRRWSWPLRWLPKASFAAVVLTSGVLAYHHFETTERSKRAESLVTVSEVSSLPGPDVLADFEAIQAMNQTPPADVELLKLFQ
jgi:hypothetical protein